jgi:hypothetical protein
MSILGNQGRRPLFGPASQTSYGLDWQRKAQPSSIRSAIDDAQGLARDVARNLGIGPEIFYGRVVDVVAYAQCYRVLLDRNGGVVLCMSLTAGSLLPVGAVPIVSIGPGSEVVVLMPRAPGSYGIILGSFPAAMTTPELALSDFVHQSSRCGLRVDRTHSAPFGCDDHGGIPDWSDGRPFDSLSVGEWGAFAETGLRQFLDSFMVQCAVDEATGVFAFYHDQLLRLAGYNTQAFSGGHEFEVGVDQCEVHNYDGYTPYPWEQCGSVTDDDPYRELDPQASQVDQPHYAAWEPKEDDQMPFHRSLLFRGYLGQGGKRMVQAPPQAGPNTYSAPIDGHAALFEENLGLDGRYSLRSAKAVHIVKYAAIPPVKRMRRIEDADGDNETNYKFAGSYGEGPDHKVTGEIESSDDDNPHLQQAAGLMDVHAWVFNWLGAHPFHYHGKDWKIPEETDTFPEWAQAPITFGDLTEKFYLPRPQGITQKIDDRYEEVKYFPNSAYFSLLDDGGVVIGDGYGAEIRMCGGHIFLTAPGDIWSKSGRNLNVLAGHDVCVRAYNSMDLSATNKDLRIKAERNLHMLGGNSGGGGIDTSGIAGGGSGGMGPAPAAAAAGGGSGGGGGFGSTGGVLIECKAPSLYNYADVVGEDVEMGGFQVKVADGDAVIWARNIYLRTGGGDVQAGFIVIDANKGQESITLQGSTIVNFATDSIMDVFGGSEENSTGTNLWSAESNVIGAGCSVNGFAIFQGGLLVKGSIDAVGGYFGSDLSQAYEGKVGMLEGGSLTQAYSDLDAGEKACDQANSDADTWYAQLFSDYLYSDEHPGNDDTISAVHFTFRNPDQYLTTDFKLYEDRWQQLARLGGEELTTWKEKPITGASAEDTMPYPGKKPWQDDDTYMQMDLALFDPETGASIPRGSADKTEAKYEEPQFEDPEPTTPAEGYTIITT